jgi:hypothetical protein
MGPGPLPGVPRGRPDEANGLAYLDGPAQSLTRRLVLGEPLLEELFLVGSQLAAGIAERQPGQLVLGPRLVCFIHDGSAFV